MICVAAAIQTNAKVVAQSQPHRQCPKINPVFKQTLQNKSDEYWEYIIQFLIGKKSIQHNFVLLQPRWQNRYAPVSNFSFPNSSIKLLSKSPHFFSIILSLKFILMRDQRQCRVFSGSRSQSALLPLPYLLLKAASRCRCVVVLRIL